MWTPRRIIKYLVLLFCGFMALKPILPIGDYSRGMATGMLMIFFGIVFILFYLIALVRNIDRLTNKLDQFDWPLSAIFCLFILLFLLINNADEGKFWTSPILKSEITNSDIPSHGGVIILYKNGTFSAIRSYVDFSETYQGNYYIKNNKLYLERPELPDLTEKIISTKYEIDSLRMKLTPCQKGYNTLDISFIKK